MSHSSGRLATRLAALSALWLISFASISHATEANPGGGQPAAGPQSRAGAPGPDDAHCAPDLAGMDGHFRGPPPPDAALPPNGPGLPPDMDNPLMALFGPLLDAPSPRPDREHGPDQGPPPGGPDMMDGPMPPSPGGPDMMDGPMPHPPGGPDMMDCPMPHPPGGPDQMERAPREDMPPLPDAK